MSTFNTGFALQTPDDVPASGVFLLPMCLTSEELLLILQATEEGGLALGLGRQGAHLAPFWRALANINQPAAAIEACNISDTDIDAETRSDEAKELIRIIYKSIFEEDEEQETMPALQIQVIGGASYLVQDCGCGEFKYYALEGAAVNQVTGAPVPDVPTSSSVESFAPDALVPGGAATQYECFADAFAPFVRDVQADYIRAVYGWTNSGVTALTPYGAAVEFLQFTDKALSGNFGFDFADAGVTANELITQMNTQQYLDDLAASISKIINVATKQLSRDDLERIRVGLPAIRWSGIYPVVPFLSIWSLTANMDTIRQYQAIARSSCASGIVPAGGLPTFSALYGDGSVFLPPDVTSENYEFYQIYDGSYIMTASGESHNVANEISDISLIALLGSNSWAGGTPPTYDLLADGALVETTGANDSPFPVGGTHAWIVLAPNADMRAAFTSSVITPSGYATKDENANFATNIVVPASPSVLTLAKTLDKATTTIWQWWVGRAI